MTPHLFAPLPVRGVTFRNRIAMSAMCQYSSPGGMANDWHLVHLGSRAVGGAGLVLTEATAVSLIGRISPDDLGLWDDSQIDPLARIARFIDAQGAAAGIQLAHAGRKASTRKPWDGLRPLTAQEGGWTPVAPSSIPFADGYPVPQELTVKGIRDVIRQFTEAANRANGAGFRVIEIHAAHGYLLHEFLSPFSNRREDEYGGSVTNRMRVVREVVEAVRTVWPERYPLLVRISATDWLEEGWGIEDSVLLAEELRELGVDLVDCSSGGIIPGASATFSPGYQVGLAEQIRREAGVLTGAVGLITDSVVANNVIRAGQADLILLGRELLRNPYWPFLAARELSHAARWPEQYLRAQG